MRLSAPPWRRRHPASLWFALAALALVLLWYALLPSYHFQESPMAVWLQGPIPVWLGACVGLWRHRARRGWRKALAVAAYAFLGALLAVGYLSFTYHGVIPTPAGIAAAQFVSMHPNPSPLPEDVRAWQWEGVRSLLSEVNQMLFYATVVYWVVLAVGRIVRRKPV